MANTPSSKDSNPDPITGAPGAHPVGTGVGAAVGGMATGAAAGTIAAGPIGTVVGAAIGAVAGGLAGKAVAEHFDPTAEEAYWRDNYSKQPYYQSGMSYDDYKPAYNMGMQSRGKYAGKRFDEVEKDLGRDYDSMKGSSKLTWEHAKQATRAAWDRVENAATGKK